MKRLVPALLVSAVLAGVVVAATDLALADVAELWGALDWPWVAAGFLLYLASYVGRGLRLGVLLPGSARVMHLVSISARHNLFNLVLPFRAGELTLPWMLQAEAGCAFAKGTATLVVMRLLDLVAVGGCCLLGLAAGAQLSLPAETLPWRLALVVVALLAAVVLLRAAALALARRPPGPRRWQILLHEAAAHLASLGRGQLARAALASVLSWMLTYAACYAVVRAMASAPGELGGALARVDFAASLVGTTGLHLAGVLPVSTIAAVGTWEAGWTAGYVLVGLPEAAAAASAVVSHVLIFGFIVVLGGAGLLRRRWSG